MPEILHFPSVAEAEAAKHKLDSFMSDLDRLVTVAEHFAGKDMTLEEARPADARGWPDDERERDVDVAAFARLLVFSDEALADAELIAAEARRLRQALLTSYREYVIEEASHA